ncbi:hypothetical protein [Massilia sp. Leaf139]|uniref:hypothetical protein n=1 Tax=Massilia sp. Leaf139 TaxID=1736272 RepID=UPI0006F375FD|nr:hypothetical protein [Massilia sp. Leaf139]KQQ87409.1 hypothetical protein ASF77_17755 [Massilia sp. Leaf139]
MNVWALLGIAPTADEREIKRAYARKLKLTRPDDDPAAFQALNEAYQMALRMAPHYAQAEEPDEADEQDKQDNGGWIEQAEPEPVAAQLHEPAPQPAWERPATPQRPQAVRAQHAEAPSAPEEQVEAWEQPLAALREEAWEHPVPFLRALPDPVALERQRRRERERARAEAQAASDAAFEVARRLWADFINLSTVAPKWHLRKLADSEELQNLEVRDHLELFAIGYCAAESCPEDLREAIVTFYGWEDDDSFVSRRLPDAAGEAFARLRADRAYAALLERSSSEPAVAALLADGAGWRFGRTLRSKFTRTLQDEIARIRTYQPELLHFKLNRDLFEEWERRVAGRRYFLETALWSLVLGLFGINLLAELLLDYWGLAVESGIRVAVCAALGVAGGAFWTLKRPLTWFQNSERMAWLLHEQRYRAGWQLGWIPVYALLSALLFVPDPPRVFAWLLGTALVGCALVASFANSVMLAKAHYIMGGLGACLFGGAMASKGFAAYGYVTCIASAYCALQLLYRGGADLWARIPEHAHLLLPLRCTWLAGTVVLVLGADRSLLPLALHAALCWLWVLGGMLLSNPTIHYFAAGVGGVVLLFGMSTLRPASPVLSVMPMSMLVTPLFGVAIFMFMNMIRAKKNQHPFS